MKAKGRLRVLLADDHRMFAEGLRKLLEPRVEVIGVAGDGSELLDLAASLNPDLVVCDLSMSGVDGLEATRRLTANGAAVQVVVLSAHDQPAHVRGAFQAGARGYVVKSSEPEELFAALDAVRSGRFFASPAVTGHLVSALIGDQLASGKTSEIPGEVEVVRVLIVDDDPDFRLIARAQLERAGVEVVGEAQDGRQGVELALTLEPDVVLMDLQMPEMNGDEAIRRIHRERPAIRVLVVTAVEVDAEILEAIHAGAAGYVSKPPDDDLGVAVRRVHSGDAWLPVSITRQLLALQPAPGTSMPLTEREAEISRLVARGWSNQRIADCIHVSETTVRTHLKRVFDKLELHNRVELALYAVRTGLAPLEESPARTLC